MIQGVFFIVNKPECVDEGEISFVNFALTRGITVPVFKALQHYCSISVSHKEKFRSYFIQIKRTFILDIIENKDSTIEIFCNVTLVS